MFAILFVAAALAAEPVAAPAPAAAPVAPAAAPAAPAAPVAAEAAAPAAPAAEAAPVESAPVVEEKKEEVVVPASDAEAVAEAGEAFDAFAAGKWAFGALLLCAVVIYGVKKFASKKKAE